DDEHDDARRRTNKPSRTFAVESAFRPNTQTQTGYPTLRSTPPGAFAHDFRLAAGFLARGSRPLTTFPGSDDPSGLKWSSARRLQLRGQLRHCLACARTHRIPLISPCGHY